MSIEKCLSRLLIGISLFLVFFNGEYLIVDGAVDGILAIANSCFLFLYSKSPDYFKFVPKVWRVALWSGRLT